jgi:cytochrome c-type biogenesis protein CcmH/NrfF
VAALGADRAPGRRRPHRLIVGYVIPPFQIWSLILWGITGLLGVLGAMFLMTRLSTTAMYRRSTACPAPPDMSSARRWSQLAGIEILWA